MPSVDGAVPTLGLGWLGWEISSDGKSDGDYHVQDDWRVLSPASTPFSDFLLTFSKNQVAVTPEEISLVGLPAAGMRLPAPLLDLCLSPHKQDLPAANELPAFGLRQSHPSPARVGLRSMNGRPLRGTARRFSHRRRYSRPPCKNAASQAQPTIPSGMQEIAGA